MIYSSLILAPGSTLDRWVSSLILNENKRQNLSSSSPFSMLLMLKNSLTICYVFTSTARKDQFWWLNSTIHSLSLLLLLGKEEVPLSNNCDPELLKKYTLSLTYYLLTYSSHYLVKSHSFIMLCIPKPRSLTTHSASYMHEIQMEKNGNAKETWAKPVWDWCLQK